MTAGQSPEEVESAFQAELSNLLDIHMSSISVEYDSDTNEVVYVITGDDANELLSIVESLPKVRSKVYSSDTSVIKIFIFHSSILHPTVFTTWLNIFDINIPTPF